MTAAVATRITVRAEVAADMNSLLVFGRGASESENLGRAFADRGIPARRAYGGVRISPADSAALLDATDLDVDWAEGALRFLANRRDLARRHRDAVAAVRALREGGRAGAEAALRDMGELDLLDDHQVVNVAAMCVPGSPGLCIFDEQGTGKTVTTIFGFDALSERREVAFLLILAPKSMVPEWVSDFERFKPGLYRVVAASGDRRAKRAALRARPDVVVTNYETAVSMEAELAAHLRQFGGRAMLAVDESFFVKNGDAARTRAVRRLREECDRAFVLCGTPAPNSPHDVVEQFNVADFGATFAAAEVPDDREAALPFVRAILQERGLFVRSRKAEVLPDLPSRRYTRVPLELQPQQRVAYEKALDDLIVTLREGDDADFARKISSVLARRSALLQICASPGSVIPGYREVPAKLVALDAILEDAVARRGEKVVVWSFFTASIDAIMERYARFSPVRYDGSVGDVAARRAAVRAFQEDDTTMLFVANPAAAGAGLTLHRARVAVYESLSTQAAHFLQSLDRIHRRGQTRDVEYVFLVCDGSIEQQEYERIEAKEAAARDLLSDHGAPAASREVFLRDALDLMRLLEDA